MIACFPPFLPISVLILLRGALRFSLAGLACVLGRLRGVPGGMGLVLV